MARSIATLKARGTYKPNEYVNEAKFPPLTVAEHLEMLALGERIARYYRHPSQVDQAVKAGASWEQIAAATGTTEDAARAAYREWADGQHKYAGMGAAEYAAAIEAAADVAERRLNVAHCVISAIADSDGATPWSRRASSTPATPRACTTGSLPIRPRSTPSTSQSARTRSACGRSAPTGSGPLVIHDERRIPDPAGHVIEDEIHPCPCGARCSQQRRGTGDLERP